MLLALAEVRAAAVVDIFFLFFSISRDGRREEKKVFLRKKKFFGRESECAQRERRRRRGVTFLFLFSFAPHRSPLSLYLHAKKRRERNIAHLDLTGSESFFGEREGRQEKIWRERRKEEGEERKKKRGSLNDQIAPKKFLQKMN